MFNFRILHSKDRYTQDTSPSPPTNINELKQRRRPRQRERQKKTIGLDWQNNNFARASRFFVHFFAFVARLQRESA